MAAGDENSKSGSQQMLSVEISVFSAFKIMSTLLNGTSKTRQEVSPVLKDWKVNIPLHPSIDQNLTDGLGK